MLMPSCCRSGLVLLLLAALVTAEPGIIEIVEEQRCHDHAFRLTCRDLDTHIAVLEAWYTATRDIFNLTYFINSTSPKPSRRYTDLDQVFFYSSPKHNGFYEATNSSLENVTQWDTKVNETVGSVNESVLVSEPFRTMNETSVNEDVNTSCGIQPYVKSYASWKHKGKILQSPRETSMNLRAPVSYRCTGINHCNFILGEDYPPALSWSPGVVFIKYACFDDLVSVHYCNRVVSIAESGVSSEGYVRTPGYPHFYAGGVCPWRLTAHAEQKLTITLLDVSLRSIGPFESECIDYVEVLESNGARLLSTCDQPELPLQLTSAGNQLDVLVVARSQGAFPKRGVLLHYKSVGCVTLTPPSNGYLVYRDNEVAHYMCNANYIFVDSQQRARLIKCFDDNIWNDTLPPCILESQATGSDNSTSADGAPPPHRMANENNMMVDIVIPSLLIAVLFIGNAFIVLIIYKYRKRKTDETEDEFNTIPLSVNGNVHSAGNAV